MLVGLRQYRASARIRGPKHDTRFEWPVSILIMTRYPFLPLKTHKKCHKILVYLRSPAPFDFAVTTTACPPNFEYTHLLLRSADWWRHNILFSIARTIWTLSECKLSTDNYVDSISYQLYIGYRYYLYTLFISIYYIYIHHIYFYTFIVIQWCLSM